MLGLALEREAKKVVFPSQLSERQIRVELNKELGLQHSADFKTGVVSSSMVSLNSVAGICANADFCFVM